MIIDMRTRMPHGQLATHIADMEFHARRLGRVAEELAGHVAALRAVDLRGLAAAIEAAR